jgi:hypothetical protein
VIDPFGAEHARLAGIEAGRLDARITSDALRRARVATPLRRDSRPDLLARAIARLDERSPA